VDKIVLTIFLFLSSFAVFGQNIQPQGHFHKDSVKIGEELPYSLWLRYPKDLDVAFPDSLFDYSPFELDKRTYFTTRTDSLLSLDSAVYYFSTFEIDTVQYLSLPVFVINEYDSSRFSTGLDSIILDQVVIAIPDSIAVLVNTSYNEVPLAFNYPYFTAGLLALLVILILTYIFFGKRIRVAIKIYWLKKRHKKFTLRFEEKISQKPILVEETIGFWKSYLEKLLKKPYTKLTSKEISSITDNSELSKNLRLVDRDIYAGDHSTNTEDAFKYLLTHALEQYQHKVKEVKNG